ncbi:MAG: hypothetical protein IJD62_04625, partial [Oscillospiraceae bacterium]|nr:hypothetical protein [Oscillospiraceae bacterium]
PPKERDSEYPPSPLGVGNGFSFYLVRSAVFAGGLTGLPLRCFYKKTGFNKNFKKNHKIVLTLLW